MRRRGFRLAAWMVLGLASCAIARSEKLADALNKRGFEALQGEFRILDPVPMVCQGLIPTTWYNNVQSYMTAVLPGAAGENPAWEITPRLLYMMYMLRQDEALLVVGNTPPPMAYFSYQTFLFGRYNIATYSYDRKTGGFFAPYEIFFAYTGDTVNSLTVQTTGSTPFNRPFALISTANRTTAERLRAALRTAGYPDAEINTETLPSSLLRFGYDKADQFLFLIRSAIADGGKQQMKEWQQSVVAGKVMQVYRVRPKTEVPIDPLPAPALRVRGTGQTEIDMYPTMEKLREGILARFGDRYQAQELDTVWPDAYPEGYPAIQRGIVYLGPGRDGSVGYGRDANYWVSSWFDLPEDAFAIAYGLDHAATGKATYSSAAVYLDETLAAGMSGFDTADLAATPHTAASYAPGEPGIDKFYAWKVARHCNGEPACVEAQPRPDVKDVCAAAIPADARVRIGFRQYAEPATKIGPADSELVYDRVILFRRK